jgi:catechol 2,3-dioxygenase-like lactoylglutathione lyase family enzyme
LGRPEDKTVEQVTTIAQTAAEHAGSCFPPGYRVRDIRRSRHFYDHALRPLGLVRIVDFGNGRGSDYGAAPGSLGVEFTITREPTRFDFANSLRPAPLP